MKRFRASVALAIVTASFLVGCGGSGDTPAPDASKVEPLPPSAIQSDAGSSDAAK